MNKYTLHPLHTVGFLKSISTQIISFDDCDIHISRQAGGPMSSLRVTMTSEARRALHKFAELEPTQDSIFRCLFLDKKLIYLYTPTDPSFY